MNDRFQQQVNRGCRSKRAYACSESANLVLQKMVRSGAKLGAMRVYQCRFCAFFHIGHIEQKRESA